MNRNEQKNEELINLETQNKNAIHKLDKTKTASYSGDLNNGNI